MINNLEQYFLKYKLNIQSKSKIEEVFLLYLQDKFNFNLKKENLKIDTKNKSIKIINIPSSVKFVLKNTLSDQDLKEYKINETFYKILI